MRINVLKYNVIIFLSAILLFVPFLGAVHLFDWDEINFAECAREMLVTKDFFSITINYLPFWEKPPIFIWMQASSMYFFGINEFAARLPNAICGIITLLLLFNIGRKLYDIRFGLLWTLAYAGSFLPHFYFKSGIIDPWFNLFIFLGIYYFILFANNNSNFKNKPKQYYRILIISALFIGLAILTKGPVAGLVFGLCFICFWISQRFKPIISFKQFFVFIFYTSLVGGLWFLMLVISGNSNIIKDFFLYQVRLLNTQDAGHGGPFFYHWIILLIGCFPASIFALSAFKRNTYDTPYQRYFKLWMMILFFVVLILFSLVKTKIVHYSSLCYFPLTFLGAYTCYKLMNKELKWKKYTSPLLLIIAAGIGTTIAALPFIDKYKQRIISTNIIKDQFALENLKTTVNWVGYEWLIGALFIIGIGVMLILMYKKYIKIAIVGIFLLSLFTVNLSSLIIAPQIEKYSQASAIEFYEYLQNKDCYVETLGFKSYAQLFYTHKQPPKNKNSYSVDWLLSGSIDKPTYFVSKITEAENIHAQHVNLKEIYRKNGFVFWYRSIF
ncbi:MAG: glycosyltransferase family 39 protein [Bacteroidia bacterium]